MEALLELPADQPPTTTEELLSLFGVSEPVIALAHHVGVTVEPHQNDCFAVSYDGTVIAFIPVKKKAIALAKEGKLGEVAKQAISGFILEAIDEAVAQYNAKAEPGKKAPTVKEVEKMIELVNEKAQPVPLSEAKHLYQKVPGTSKGSIYRVVALLDGVSVAARGGGSSLSVRIEGPKADEYATSLTPLGFAKKSGGHYSVHYEGVDKQLAATTIGAILGAMGMDKVVKAGDIRMVWGQS